MSKQSLMTMVADDLDDSRLQGLGMYVLLKSMSDAGHTHSQVTNELFGRLDSQLFATFDADELVAYTSQRPRLTFLGDHFAGYQAPRIEIYLMTDEMDRKFWFLTGVEPDLKWERVISELLGFIEAFNVSLVVGSASLPMPVPHTRPVGVTAHGNRKDLIENISTWSPTVESPAGITSLLEIRMTEAGRDIVGYSLHTPHYLAESEYPAAAVATLEYVGAALKLALPTDKLREAGRLVDQQLAEQLEANNDVRQMVDGFEERFDAHVQEHEPRSLLLDEDKQMPGAEELGASAEHFLAAIENTDDWLRNGHDEPSSGDQD
ncbi:PAC2 family protein [Glutamicibacter mishrai]|uniref:PAC2 family protein n=1 Tax=Glutamicibacter mishrai TaxID=1775880 RepID=A0A6H0SEV0_9MICC|nr:PAC2 family protein [Glutamicibacter mishrai]QIV85918.1 PAC2 family protein [Glutamicibacter mishrai]UTT38471.1 PAC2 family protein [Glutamicibacter mishrai]